MITKKRGKKMKRKMCDHPAGVIFAVIVAGIVAFLNYSVGDIKTASVSLVFIVLIYAVCCLLCKRKEDSENEKGK